MDKRVMYLALFLAVVLMAFLLHNYMFSIYETTFRITPQTVFADGKSEITIEAVPVNGLGFRAPFRKAQTTFVLEEGKDLVDVLVNDPSAGLLRLRVKSVPGKVTVFARPKFALLPSQFIITIEAMVAAEYQSSQHLF